MIENKSVAEYYRYDQGLKEITEIINQFIQTLNYEIPRNIPYISLSASKDFHDAARIVIRDNPDIYDDGVFIQIEDQSFLDITHLIDLFIVDGGFYLDEPVNPKFNVEVILNSKYTRMIIIDIFLDIAFFNSYSFLKNASLKEKQEFSKKKYEF